jgi:hypothetical protein
MSMFIVRACSIYILLRVFLYGLCYCGLVARRLGVL